MTRKSQTGKRNARSPEWQKIRTLEDVLAILSDADQERVLIKRRAWVNGEAEIFAATNRQQEALATLKALLSNRWHELMDDIETE